MKVLGVLLLATLAFAQEPPFQPVATVSEIMDAIISPASKAVFDAVSTSRIPSIRFSEMTTSP